MIDAGINIASVGLVAQNEVIEEQFLNVLFADVIFITAESLEVLFHLNILVIPLFI